MVYGILNTTNKRVLTIMIHGNAGNVSDRTHMIKPLGKAFESDVFLWEYPGFGRLHYEGYPTCELIINRMNTMIRYWSTKYDKIIIYGESIGCLFTSYILTADRNQISHVILQSGPSSLTDMFKHLVTNKLPLYISELDGLDNYSKLSACKHKPHVLIMHSKSDEIVPYSQAKLVRDQLQATTDVKMIKIDGGHNNPVIPWKVVKKYYTSTK